MLIGHGGNREGLAKRLGCRTDEITDMSSNLNPLGPPEMVESFLQDNVTKIRSLPQPDASGMRNGFARYYDMDPDRVVAGNGTTWFIYTLPFALKLKRALVIGPTYSDYRDACRMFGTQVVFSHTRAENRFLPDMDDILSKAGECGAIFVCNPNNPTGMRFPEPQLRDLIRKNPHALVVVDESYLPFVDDADALSFVRRTEYRNVAVLSSMSKIFRIPGLRTGFISADPVIIDKLIAIYQPWSVNALAQAVIEHIFSHPDQLRPFYATTREYVKTQKDAFLQSLAGLGGIELFGEGEAYFVLARLTGAWDAPGFCRAIGNYRILIRDCTNFEGLGSQYVRFSLKTEMENQALSSSIKEVLTHG